LQKLAIESCRVLDLGILTVLMELVGKVKLKNLGVLDPDYDWTDDESDTDGLDYEL